MKKTLLVAITVLLTLTAAPAVQAHESAGGFVGGVIGCCFGIRSAAAYNDGKCIHPREWLRIVPFVSLVVGVWDCIDGWKGVTTADLRAKAGAEYY